MPIKPENKSRYPDNWKQIRVEILKRAKHCCEFCGAENYEPHPITGSKVILTIAHLDHIPENSNPGNLKALCQKCHLSYDKEHHAKNARITRDKKSGTLRLFEEQ